MTDPFEGKAIEEAAKLVPEVYRDALKPAVREVGTTLGRAVRMALAPVRAAAWSWEHAEEWCEGKVADFFAARGTAAEDIVVPPAQVTAGVIRGIQAAGPEPDSTLRDLFAGLLATAMDRERTGQAHPAFAEMLSQLSTDEARILVHLARTAPTSVVMSLNVENQNFENGKTVRYPIVQGLLEDEVPLSQRKLIPSYLVNLARLGLTVEKESRFYDDDAMAGLGVESPRYEGQGEDYRDLRRFLVSKRTDVGTLVEYFEKVIVDYRSGSGKGSVSLRIEWLSVTPFGQLLLEAVVSPELWGTLSAIKQQPT
jgi:hypothetical protein